MNSDLSSQGGHVALEPKALVAGRLILRSAMDYGFVGPLDLSTEVFHHELQPAARAIRAAREAGSKEFSDIVLHLIQSTDPGPAQDLLRAQIAEVGEETVHIPEALEKSAETVRQYALAKRRSFLIWELATADGQAPGRMAEIVKELGELEAGGASRGGNLRERAYALSFDPNKPPPPDETCMSIGDIPIASRGNLTVIQGKSKVGKSAVVAAVMGAAQRGNQYSTADSLCISWEGDGDGSIIHLDTEQSLADWHGLVSRSVTRSGLPEVSERLVSLPLVMFARSERLEILRQTLEHEAEARGSIDAVVIDGIADLCLSPNDEEEALEVVSQVMALSQKFSTPVFCVLHENPGTDMGKTRGHLGSELNRKAFANLRIDKDAETSISTLYGLDMRKREIPKEQGFCFAWNDKAKMHTFQGRAAGLKAAQAEQKNTEKARDEFTRIFNLALQNCHSSGTNTPCPALTPKEAAELERDISGTEKLTKPETMKKRMQRAETLGVLRKSGLLHWTLAPAGQAGQ